MLEITIVLLLKRVLSSSCRSVLMAVGRNSLLLVDTVLVGLILIFLDEIGELLMIDTLDTL